MITPQEFEQRASDQEGRRKLVIEFRQALNRHLLEKTEKFGVKEVENFLRQIAEKLLLLVNLLREGEQYVFRICIQGYRQMLWFTIPAPA